MKDQITKNDVLKFKKASHIFSVLFTAMVLSTIPLIYFFENVGLVIWLILAAIALLYSIYVEKLKKQHNIQTYKEIAAFMEGKRLDELESAEERGKRPYQKVMWILLSALAGAALGALYALITKG